MDHGVRKGGGDEGVDGLLDLPVAGEHLGRAGADVFDGEAWVPHHPLHELRPQGCLQGLALSGVRTQNSPGVEGTAETGYHLGNFLTWIRLDHYITKTKIMR